MAILSIQSHVVYGYVGNKAAVYPLQSMGYDVWPVNTVQFSTHTGYQGWKGEVFPRTHIREIIQALENFGIVSECKAILSGYMGSADTCFEVMETVQRFKTQNDKILYLCDPVIGNQHCYVKPEVLDFFKTSLHADIITPNQFEAETLSGIIINNKKDLQAAADYFHNLGIRIVVITGIKITNSLYIFVSDQEQQHLIEMDEYEFKQSLNGTGDLFSAVFLGSYLAHQNAIEAAKNAAYYMDLVIKNTITRQVRELQVISASYDASSKNSKSSMSLK